MCRSKKRKRGLDESAAEQERNEAERFNRAVIAISDPESAFYGKYAAALSYFDVHPRKRGSLKHQVKLAIQNVSERNDLASQLPSSNRQPVNKILLLFHSPLLLLMTLQPNPQLGAPFTRTRRPCTKPVYMVVHVELLRLSHSSTRPQSHTELFFEPPKGTFTAQRKWGVVICRNASNPWHKCTPYSVPLSCPQTQPQPEPQPSLSSSPSPSHSPSPSPSPSRSPSRSHSHSPCPCTAPTI